MKFKNWNGEDLQGDYLISIKIDGIQGRKKGCNGKIEVDDEDDDNILLSKNDKKLTNIPKTLPQGQIFEIFNGTCNGTWSVVSGPEGERKRITKKELYKLFPVIDERLILVGKITNPTANQIMSWFTKARFDNHEGLVLRRLDKEEAFIKVKSKYTIDAKVISIVEGKGKFKGKLGKFVTEYGGVGVGKGLTMKVREELWKKRKQLIATTIEVDCMELTENKKFRQPKFVKLRPDK